MTHNNQEERSVEELDEIQRLIVEKDPDDNDKFLRQLWDLVAQAKETFHHQLQKAREEERERIKTTIETLLLGVQPLPDDADTFMGEHEKTAVKAGYMVKEWVMEAFKEPDHPELD